MAKDVALNKRLLELAAFEPAEIEECMDDWMFTTEVVELSDEDIRYALEEFIPQNWDIKFLGVRKMIGAYLRELIDIALTKRFKEQGKKLVYGILPAVCVPYVAMKKTAGDDAYVSFPDLMLVTILNGFFHKAGPFLTKAEGLGLTYGCRHCPLNKMRVASFASGIVAAPDIIWSWGLNCDEGPKTDEMMQCMMGEEWQYIVSRVAHDTYFGEKDDEYERVKYLAGVLKEDMEQICDISGIHPTPEAMNEAIAESGRYAFKLGTLIGLVCKADPVPLGGNTMTQFGQGVAVPFNRSIKYLEEALDVMIQEVREEIKAGRGVLPKGAPKIGSYFVPFCIPWIDRLFRENGVATTFSETLTPSKSQLAPPKYKDDPYMSFAETWLKMPFGQNMGYEAQSMIEKVNENKPDGMLMGFFDFDRWLGAHQKMCADLVEKETGVPHFYMESDFWDDRDYSEEALRTRIESISQLMYLRKDME